MKAEEFEPFSEEWKNEMMKFTKIGLIECLLKPALIKNKELIEENKNQFENMQYYLEYCQYNEYVTPQVWIEIHKHF